MKRGDKPYTKEEQVKNFWSFVKKGNAEECWPWASTEKTGGYGQTKFEGRLVGTHRLAWILTHKEIPKGIEVCHKCDYPPCCNPNHLFLGTHRDNMRDAGAKGRKSGRRNLKRTPKPGMALGKVVYCYRMFNKLTLSDMEKETGVQRMTLWRIEQGRYNTCRQWPALLRWLFKQN